MRIIVMFDMPTDTLQEKRAYRYFRKYLVKDGFFMMQESIYVKIAINAESSKSILKRLERKKPEYGLVQIMQVTERQFEKMIYLVGKPIKKVISSDKRLVIV
ncbi:MAG: CRISPR-associated endonuclease Cas2 [Candidatus Dojkabacteria bacterium]|nr:MAG: CRISPR-associated endonuclease Cas2 [Candidatus Dojkabacteria bacterium]